MADLQNLSKEELMTLCEEQERRLRDMGYQLEYYTTETNKLRTKIQTLKNVIEL